MIITLVKDDPKDNPSGKRQFSPRYSLKGDPVVYEIAPIFLTEGK